MTIKKQHGIRPLSNAKFAGGRSRILLRMDIDELRTFVSIARSSSFAAAARELNRTQPAISRRIASLEMNCGATLLERLPSGARLTLAGKALLPHAYAALASIEDGRRACSEATGSLSEVTRLVVVGTLVGQEIANAVESWRGVHPAAEVPLVTANSARISELITSGGADIGLRYHVDSRLTVDCMPAGADRMVLVASRKYDGPLDETVFATSMNPIRWITFSSRRPTRDTFDKQIIKRFKIQSRKQNIVECDSLLAQKTLIEANFGIGLLPFRLVENDLNLGLLKRIEIANHDVVVPIFLVTRRKGFLSKASQVLHGNLKTVFSE